VKAGARVSAVSYQGDNKRVLEAIARGGGSAVVAASKRGLADAVLVHARLPVDLPLAVVLVLDRSGSMTGARLEAAKEAARVTAEVLGPNDMIAVVAFDSEAQVFVRLQRPANKPQILREISRITSGGGTNIVPGLKEASEILHNIADVRRHVILLTDGEAPDDGIVELVDTMRNARITVSAVGLQGADRNLLSRIADHGEGRLYMIEDIAALPKIFMKETTSAP
jgi:Mg-chelatase subunit ChlD